jgi:hypothetical protein
MRIQAHPFITIFEPTTKHLHPWYLPTRLISVLAFSFVFNSSTSLLAIAQAPGQPNAPGAPASDVSNLPRPISDTMDRVAIRDARKAAPGEQKPPEIEDSCLLPPLNLVPSLTVAATALAIPAKARKEYLEACGALKGKKPDDAEKHLRMAVHDYRKYSVAWVTLGQMLSAQSRMEEARNACSQGSTVEPDYVPAYLCLADLAARDRAWGDVLLLTNRALQLNPNANPIAYEYNAAANLRINKLDDAEKSALLALANDKNNGEPRIHFVLAQIYEAKGDRANEIAQLRAYLKFAKDPGDMAAVKVYLSQLEQSPANDANLAVQNHREVARSVPDLPADQHLQADAEIRDGNVPSAASLDLPALGGNLMPACRLDEVLPEVEHRVQEFVENLQRFTATESRVLESFDGTGRIVRTERQQYEYTVSILRSVPGMLQVNEFQNTRSYSATSEREIVTSGLPALILIFHPYYAGDFSMECEGLTVLNGKPAWQIRFRQREDKPSRIRSYAVGAAGRAFQLNLKGRAWFLASNHQVLKLETDLIKPVSDIHLAVDHTSAEYGPVHFRSRGIDVWLPQAADLICERNGKRRHERIDFTDFFLFAVDNKQELGAPKVRECSPGNENPKAGEIPVCPKNNLRSQIIRY